MSRLFTFGCSFTKYYWETWADIVGTQFEVFQNWGQAGAGNTFISNNLYECHSLYNINKNDVVMIMFSSIDRFDFINKNSNYRTSGSVYNENHPLGKDFILNEWSDEHAIYNTWYSIISSKQLLDSIGCKYVLMKAFNFEVLDGDQTYNTGSNRIHHCLKEINNIIKGPNLSHVNKIINNHYYFDDLPNKTDGHPTIKTHLKWVKENLQEYYTEEMDKICEEWEKDIPPIRNDSKRLLRIKRNFLDFNTKKLINLI
jgi:hypothetical protein